MKSTKSKKIVFTIEKARTSIVEENWFIWAAKKSKIDILFSVNRDIPTIEFRKNHFLVGYRCNMVSDSQGPERFYSPATSFVKEKGYTLHLYKEDDFYKAVRGLACFIQFGNLGNIDNPYFEENDYEGKPNFTVKYSSSSLKKKLEKW